MTYLYLKPITWTQSIRRYPTIDVNGPYLSAPCTTKSVLILSEKLKLSDLQINLSILRGTLPDKGREEGKLSERAIGGIWWISDDNFVHSWFYLPAEDYDAIWEQIKQGDYIDCQITLGTVMEFVKSIGGEFAWKGNPISVESVEVTFKRKAIKEDEKEDSETKPIGIFPLAGNKRYWAVVLFLIAAGMFVPFPGPLEGLTTGEGRIISAITFVGGLLLWFMRR